MRGRIDRVKSFLDRPDREHSFKRWLTMLMEDCLVIDALTFYRQRTISGEPFALVPIDGSTIKPIVYVTAFSQAILLSSRAGWDVGAQTIAGVSANPVGSGIGSAALTFPQDGATLSLILMVFTLSLAAASPIFAQQGRPVKPAPVERIIITVNLALRRQLHYLAFYTDGNIPEAFWKCPEKWEPSQIESMQDIFEKLLSGESGLRRRLRFMPGGEGAGLSHIPEAAKALGRSP